MILLLTLLLLLFVYFIYLALKHQLRFIRLFASGIGLCLALETFVIWFFVGENWILEIGLGISIFVTVVVLLIPIINPKLMELLDFEW
jgi:hypothetical protein